MLCGMLKRRLLNSSSYLEWKANHLSNFDPSQDVRVKIRWKRHDDQVVVDFVQPVSEKSRVYNYLLKTGSGLNRLCYEGHKP